MHLDILIFAVIAAILIYRLNAALGSRGDDDRPRPNPFAAPETPAPPASLVVKVVPSPLITAVEVQQLIDPAANADGRIEGGLQEISAVDPAFDLSQFMTGARYAFEMIVTAYARGDRAALRPLLSPKLYADFDRGITEREMAGHASATDIHRILSARINEAHLGGTMAYITVHYNVEQTSVTCDKTGAIVEGNPDHVIAIEDVWTFTRDTRSADPNWILIETRAVEKPAS